MPFIPHTDTEIKEMLTGIGARSIDDLFDEIPAELRAGEMTGIPQGINEAAVSRVMRQRAAQDGMPLCFAGAGAYEHHIPAAVWEITTRGEYYSAYTPYQAEASQGTLQIIYEYQTMMAKLLGMEVSNASLYDGASGLAEAVLMAARSNRKSKSGRVLVPRTVHPSYRKVLGTILNLQDIELIELDYDRGSGTLDPKALEQYSGEDITALIVPQPNFFGMLEDVDALTDWAREQGAVSIASVNPTAMALLSPPGEWGAEGADIASGEGQPLGIPLSSGGPYFGFMCCKKSFLRQLPGRLVGRAYDGDGRRGFTLTLQAREQHIRRAKAKSNICTNQGLMVTAATIYMALLGPEGLYNVALASHQRTRKTAERLAQIAGVSPLFEGPYFHEAALSLPVAPQRAIEAMAGRNIVPGVALNEEYPELGEAMLVCATETKTDEDIEHFANELTAALA